MDVVTRETEPLLCFQLLGREFHMGDPGVRDNLDGLLFDRKGPLELRAYLLARLQWTGDLYPLQFEHRVAVGVNFGVQVVLAPQIRVPLVNTRLERAEVNLDGASGEVRLSRIPR